jgi:hypothetical protein
MAELITSVRRRRIYGGAVGVLGILVPTIGLIILPIWRFPSTNAAGAQISEFASQHRTALRTTMLCYTLGVSLWLVFGSILWARLRSEEESGSVIPTCFAAGLIGFVTLLLAGFTAFDILVYRGTGASESRLLYDLGFGMLAMSGMPTAISLGAFATSIYRYRWLRRYTADLAAVTAAAHVLLLLSFVANTGFFSLEGAVITVIPALLWAWILITGVALMRSADTGSVDRGA